MRTLLIATLLVAFTTTTTNAAPPTTADDKPEPKPKGLPRAIAFLVAEVPRWPKENDCFSCHNNGDAARALYTAKQLGYKIPDDALKSTTEFLKQPERWRHNGGEGEFVDRKLDVVVFGHALTVAHETGAVREKQPLAAAAGNIAKDQKADGSWPVVVAGTLGAPASYGNVLSTIAARNLLQRADARKYAGRIKRANAWLLAQKPNSVTDSAGLLIGLAGVDDPKVGEVRKRAVGFIERGRDENGGWGPYVTSPAEPFDTALVLLALSQLDKPGAHAKSIAAGRKYLIDSQEEDGSWPETTRPANTVSYAHRLSTAGWATLALLKTEPRKAKPRKIETGSGCTTETRPNAESRDSQSG